MSLFWRILARNTTCTQTIYFHIKALKFYFILADYKLLSQNIDLITLLPYYRKKEKQDIFLVFDFQV